MSEKAAAEKSQLFCCILPGPSAGATKVFSAGGQKNAYYFTSDAFIQFHYLRFVTSAAGLFFPEGCLCDTYQVSSSPCSGKLKYKFLLLQMFSLGNSLLFSSQHILPVPAELTFRLVFAIAARFNIVFVYGKGELKNSFFAVYMKVVCLQRELTSTFISKKSIQLTRSTHIYGSNKCGSLSREKAWRVGQPVSYLTVLFSHCSICDNAFRLHIFFGLCAEVCRCRAIVPSAKRLRFAKLYHHLQCGKFFLPGYIRYASREMLQDRKCNASAVSLHLL